MEVSNKNTYLTFFFTFCLIRLSLMRKDIIIKITRKSLFSPNDDPFVLMQPFKEKLFSSNK